MTDADIRVDDPEVAQDEAIAEEQVREENFELDWAAAIEEDKERDND